MLSGCNSVAHTAMGSPGQARGKAVGRNRLENERSLRPASSTFISCDTFCLEVIARDEVPHQHIKSQRLKPD